MEIEGDSERDFSESDLSDEEVEVNAYGSPIRTCDRASFLAGIARKSADGG